MFFRFQFKTTNSTGSIIDVWDLVQEKMAAHMSPRAREILNHYKQLNRHFDTALTNNDCSAITEIFHKKLSLANKFGSLLNKGYSKACNSGIDNDILNKMITLDQSFCAKTDSNVTILRKMNDFYKPMANRMYHVSLTYQSNSVGEC